MKLILAAELIKGLIYYDLGFDSPYFGFLKRIWPNATPQMVNEFLSKLIPKSKSWLITKGFMDKDGKPQKPWDYRFTELQGIYLSKHQPGAPNDDINEPPKKKLRLTPSQLRGNRQFQTTLPSTNNNNSSSNGISTDQHWHNTFQNRLDQSSATQLRKLLMRDDVAQMFMSLHGIQQNPTINQQNPNSTTFAPSVPPLNHYSKSVPSLSESPQVLLAHTQLGIPTQSLQSKYDALAAEVAVLNSKIANSGSIPDPTLSTNPYHQQCDLTFAKPARGIRSLTLDHGEQGAIVKRIYNVTMGPSIDPNMRRLIRSMNSETNKELCKHLEGKFPPLC